LRVSITIQLLLSSTSLFHGYLFLTPGHFETLLTFPHKQQGKVQAFQEPTLCNTAAKLNIPLSYLDLVVGYMGFTPTSGSTLRFTLHHWVLWNLFAEAQVGGSVVHVACGILMGFILINFHIINIYMPI
jgi:hypothetical protein